MLFFDGTFYQLWYLPATIVGLVFTGFLLRCFSLRTTGILAGVLYIIGLFGDSYYGLTACIPGLQNLYDFSFQISSYTRNGILFAPAFLWLGAWIHQGHQSKTPGIPFVLSLMFLLTEGYLTWRLNLQRHNSFYVLLPLCTFYLFQLLLYIPGKAHPALRWFSMNLYVIHPFCIAVLLLIFNTVGFVLFSGDTFLHPLFTGMRIIYIRRLYTAFYRTPLAQALQISSQTLLPSRKILLTKEGISQVISRLKRYPLSWCKIITNAAFQSRFTMILE